jgi:hypothetical protein
MTSSLYITVTAQVFFDEDDIDQLMEDRPSMTREQAIEQYAFDAGFNLETKEYSVKLRDVVPNFSTLK